MHIYHLNFINDVQLGYAGSILGGSMTLIGVWWTIEYTEKNRHEDFENTFLPVPIITKNDTTYDFNSEKNKLTVTIKFSIKNVGNGPMINIQDKGAFLESSAELKRANEYGGIFAGIYVIESEQSYNTIRYPKITIKISSKKDLINAYCLISYEDSFGKKRIIKYIFPFEIESNEIRTIDVRQEIVK